LNEETSGLDRGNSMAGLFGNHRKEKKKRDKGNGASNWGHVCDCVVVAVDANRRGDFDPVWDSEEQTAHQSSIAEFGVGFGLPLAAFRAFGLCSETHCKRVPLHSQPVVRIHRNYSPM